jgi:hypothetical protein
MKIAILTCDQLPKFARSAFNTGTVKTYITAQWFGIIQIRIGVILIFLIFRNTWDYFEKKLSLIRGLKKIEKLGIKTLNPIGIIKQNKHKFYLREMERQGVLILPTVLLTKQI